MRVPIRRRMLEAAVLITIPATIVALAFGSNWSPSVRAAAQPLRWLGLALLGSLALALARPRLAELRTGPAILAAAGLAGLAVLSTLWSIDPRLTAFRAAAFAAVLAVAAALAVGLAFDRAAARRVLAAVVIGAVVVALAGLLLWIGGVDRTVQDATLQNPARFRGIGQNPNTVALLLAATLPIAVLLAADAGTRARRMAAVGAAALFGASIVASGSRGALAAATVGVIVAGLLAAPSWPRRLAALAASVALAGAGVAVARIPDPLSPQDPRAHVSASTYAGPQTRRNAELSLRLEDELGRPAGGGFAPSEHRTLLGSSGRTEAWEAGLETGARRPVVGYGFGTEERVFVDRLYRFQGGTPEQSFVGMFLQLGIVGLAMFVAVLAGLALALLRALHASTRSERFVLAASGGVLAAGTALALVQSYIYSAGNTATLAIWLCAFIPAASPR